MCFPALLAAGGAAAAGSTAAAGTAAAATAATAATTAAAATAATAATTAAAGMTAAQMISLGLSVAGTAASAIGAYRQSQMAKATAEANAAYSKEQANDAIRRGEQDAMELQRRVAATKSSQRVALAAKGLDLSYGTAADLQDQTDFFGQQDVATARNNARREANSYLNRSSGYQAEAMSNNPWMTGGSTLLAGAGQVASKWYSYTGGQRYAG